MYKVFYIISGRGLLVGKEVVGSLEDVFDGMIFDGMILEEVGTSGWISNLIIVDEVDVIVGSNDVSWEELERKFLEGCEEYYNGNVDVMESVRKGIRMAVEGQTINIM